MNSYETIFIYPPDFPSDKITSLTEKLKSIILQDNGEIISIKEWGKQKLAYKIAGYREGIYVHMEYNCNGKTISTLENTLRLTEGILRYLTVKKKKSKKIIENKKDESEEKGNQSKEKDESENVSE